MGAKINWPDSAIKTMLARIERGDSIESIARSYGVSHRSIRNAVGIKVGSGRIDRAATKREFKKKVVHVDVHLDSWIDEIATRLNTTHGTIVEMALLAMYGADRQNLMQLPTYLSYVGRPERFLIQHHLTAMETEFYDVKG